MHDDKKCVTGRRRLGYNDKLEFYADKTWRGTSSYQILRYEPNLFLQ